MRRETQAQPEDWEEGKSEGIGERGRGQGTPAIRTPFYSYLTSFFPWHFFPSPPVLFAPVTQAISRVSSGTQKSWLFHWIRMKYKVKSDSRVLLQWVADILLRTADQTSTCCRLLYHGDVSPWFPFIFRYFLGNDKNSFSLSCKISANFDTFIFRWDADLLWHLTRWTSKPENWWKFFPTVVAENVRFSVLIRNYRGL